MVRGEGGDGEVVRGEAVMRWRGEGRELRSKGK